MQYSSFEEWSAGDYLTEYYGSVMEDERHTLEFLIESLELIPDVSRAIDVGCGPCVHHAFPLVRRAREIHLADFVPNNRAEIERWLKREPRAHDWRTFAVEILRLEGRDASDASAAQLQAETRRRVTAVMPADVRRADPVGAAHRGSYPLVTSHYCVEAISTDKDVFRANLANVASLVAPGGTLVISVCGAANFYKVAERTFPCSGIRGDDLAEALESAGFHDLDLRVRSTPSHASQGYSSVAFARARRRDA